MTEEAETYFVSIIKLPKSGLYHYIFPQPIGPKFIAFWHLFQEIHQRHPFQVQQ